MDQNQELEDLPELELVKAIRRELHYYEKNHQWVLDHPSDRGAMWRSCEEEKSDALKHISDLVVSLEGKDGRW